MFSLHADTEKEAISTCQQVREFKLFVLNYKPIHTCTLLS